MGGGCATPARLPWHTGRPLSAGEHIPPSVSLWVEGSGEVVLDPQLAAHAGPRGRGELCSPVRGHRGRHTKTCHSSSHKLLSTSGSLNVFNGKGFHPSGGSINYCKHVHMPVLRAQ
jgi:hypothetical protein